MNAQLEEKLERRRKELYLAVKSQHPELYRKVVEVAHLADPMFGGDDVLKRSATLEAAIMSLVADAAGIVR